MSERSLHTLYAPDAKLKESWLREDTVGAWRMRRMFEPFTPFIRCCSGTSWLTVGDGRLGLDSIALKKINPQIEILPTDIEEQLLSEAKDRGMISRYAIENAEAFSFPDNSFDYVFCKESYHHFSRPMLGMYEMLRVARKAVLFIEPNDREPAPFAARAIEGVKKMLRPLLGKRNLHPDYYRYEVSGNYVYSLSKRDLEKIALGLNYPLVTVHYSNDYYEPGVEYEKAEGNSSLFKKVKREIRKMNWKSSLGMMSYSGLAAVIFKQRPIPGALAALEKGGFRIISLPSNPYLKADNPSPKLDTI